MEHEKRLELQAWLDGELPSHSASLAADWVKTDPVAQELVEELRSVKVLLKDCEKPAKIDDSREFYWNQIDRRIFAIEVAESRTDEVGSNSWMEWCRQWLVPMSGLAAIVLMIATVNTQPVMVQPQLIEGGGGNIQSLQHVDPPKVTPPGRSEESTVGNSESEVSAEDVNVLNLNIRTDANPNLSPGINERTIPSIENPER